MPHVTVTVNGRDYRITCGAGEEDHVRHLSTRLDTLARELSGRLGHLSEGLSLVMVGLTLADELAEARREGEALRARLAPLGEVAEQAEARDRARLEAEEQAAAVIATMAQRIETLAAHLDQA
ncbi:cell division protein ZapA [Roseospira goensis]|uniref:Cell division protein ZapA n=1 Tax=Roseospira goensis TaxID=391922 RepID=A0A7W6S0H0_9PROT|nr:cell division protein ZapA [Roseospira goensis]MBB4285957.1 cell division protein ZapA [Roseospira goensis]